MQQRVLDLGLSGLPVRVTQRRRLRRGCLQAVRSRVALGTAWPPPPPLRAVRCRSSEAASIAESLDPGAVAVPVLCAVPGRATMQGGDGAATGSRAWNC